MEMVSDCFLNLPKLVWELMILPRLSLRDYIRFGAVCRSWRSIAEENHQYLHRLPWLLISQDVKTQTGTFYSLAEAKFYELKFTELASESFCCGTSQGYLIMAHKDGNLLFNPFSQTQISLPQHFVPRKDGGYHENHYYFTKAILSLVPGGTPSQYVVAAKCSSPEIIEMCRPHQEEWSVFGIDQEADKNFEIIFYIDDELPSDDDEGQNQLREDEEEEEKARKKFTDLLFYKEKLYGLTAMNGLMCFEFQDSKPFTPTILDVLPMERPEDGKSEFITNYLVESCGELLMVYRFRYIVFDEDEVTGNHVTSKFSVYRLDESKWIEVESLGDQMLFLGKNASISISAKGIPRLEGNCIYFTDDAWPYFYIGGYKHSCLDNGVFYLDDGRIEPLLGPDDSHLFKCQPLWVVPRHVA